MNRNQVVEREGELIEIIRETIIEYYGQATWVILEKYIRNRNVDAGSEEELLEAVKEFFGGSEEVIVLIFSRYSNGRVDTNGFSLEN